MSKKKLKQKIPIKILSIIFAISIPAILLPLFLLGFLFLSQRIYPNISVSGIDVSLLTKDTAVQKIGGEVSKRGATTLEFRLQNASLSAKQKFSINLDMKDSAIPIEKGVAEAFRFGRANSYFPKAEINLNFTPSLSVKNQIRKIAEEVNQSAIDSTLRINDGEISVTPSQNGIVLDEEQMYANINDYLNGEDFTYTHLPLKIQEPKLTYAEALVIKNRLDEIKLSPISLVFEDLKFTLNLDTILTLIDLENSKDSVILFKTPGQNYNISSLNINGKEISDSKLTLSHNKLEDFLKTISLQIDRPMQEPLFTIDSGLTGVDSGRAEKPKITEFRPPVDGRELQIKKTEELVAAALITKNSNEIKLPVNIIKPKNKLTNDLGISELIGRGVSHFTGSIENRKYNIGLAASRINGILIAPGEEFSFVETVGDISGATGYKQAYVIKSGRTVLDDGGGVCQVSTTIFRAALNTGLPITARTAHAYRVGYYEQGFPPGLDATIFHPSVDFRFKNDSDKHILIQAYTTGNTLTVDLYGTTDGRTVSISKPAVSNITPAPPEIRQEDPTLPKGTVKQVDWAANGANVSFSRTVTKGGVTYINETFRSNFRPWQAIFLVGTKEG